MSWAFGVLPDGKEIGYGVAATCEEPDCSEGIDRGLAHVCGGMHEGGDHGCGGYFCGGHLFVGLREEGDEERGSGQLCRRCCDRYSGESK